MWKELHEQFHKNAQEIAAARRSGSGIGGKRGVKRDWYESQADELKKLGKVAKDDVLEHVTKYYVYESGKGFDKFAVVRTFWAVYALANASACHTDLLDQCKRMVDV